MDVKRDLTLIKHLKNQLSKTLKTREKLAWILLRTLMFMERKY